MSDVSTRRPYASKRAELMLDIGSNLGTLVLILYLIVFIFSSSTLLTILSTPPGRGVARGDVSGAGVVLGETTRLRGRGASGRGGLFTRRRDGRSGRWETLRFWCCCGTNSYGRGIHMLIYALFKELVTSLHTCIIFCTNVDFIFM